MTDAPIRPRNMGGPIPPAPPLPGAPPDPPPPTVPGDPSRPPLGEPPGPIPIPPLDPPPVPDRLGAGNLCRAPGVSRGDFGGNGKGDVMPRSCTPLAAALLASLGLAACAGTPPPTAQMGATEQAIVNAERAGALEHAPVELQRARSKLAAADEAMRDDDRDAARRLAQEAQADAELAASRAQAVTAAQAAGTVQRDLQALSQPGGGAAGYGASAAAPVPGGSSLPPGSTMGSLGTLPVSPSAVPPAYTGPSSTAPVTAPTRWNSTVIQGETVR